MYNISVCVDCTCWSCGCMVTVLVLLEWCCCCVVVVILQKKMFVVVVVEHHVVAECVWCDVGV